MSVPSSLAWHELHGDSLLCASQVESTHKKIPCKESPLIYKKNQEPPVIKKKLEEQEEAL